MAVSGVDADLVEGFPEVHLGEDSGSSNLMSIVTDVWKREEVKHSPLVQTTVVTDYAERIIRFHYKMEGTPPRVGLSWINFLNYSQLN